MLQLRPVFRIVSAATIPKTICGIEWDILHVVYNRLAGIPNVALLLPPMIQTSNDGNLKSQITLK